MKRWQQLLCRLGRHGLPALIRISGGWRHQVCSRCGADMCQPLGKAGTGTSSSEVDRG